MRLNSKVCFIAGAGHSGSTLLGLILGSHSLGFYAGEAKKTLYLGDEQKPERKRVCKLCGPRCPIWGGLTLQVGKDLYEQVAQRFGQGRGGPAPGAGSLIIDSSKSVAWIEEQVEWLASTTATPHLVFLQRDGRAVINSRVRKYPNRPAQDLIEDWSSQIRKTRELYDRFEGPKVRVRYEELATRPTKVISALCGFLGIEFEWSMLDYDETEHHPLGGNNGTQYQVARRHPERLPAPVARLNTRTRTYYEQHPRGIVLDLRWQEELAPAVATMFDDMAGADNAEMRWEAS